MIHIKILHYPIAYWDPQFFQLVTSSFGNFVQVHDDNGNGTDRTTLRLWIECRDPYTIPDYIILNYSKKWCKCRVQIDTWHALGWTPPPPPTYWPDIDPHPIHLTQPRPGTPEELLFQCHRRVLRMWRAGTPIEQTDMQLTPDYNPESLPSPSPSTTPPPHKPTPPVYNLPPIVTPTKPTETLPPHPWPHPTQFPTNPSHIKSIQLSDVPTEPTDTEKTELPAVEPVTPDREDLEPSRLSTKRQTFSTLDSSSQKDKPDKEETDKHPLASKPKTPSGPITLNRKRISTLLSESILGPFPKLTNFSAKHPERAQTFPQNIPILQISPQPTIQTKTHITPLLRPPLHLDPKSLHNPTNPYTLTIIPMDNSYEALIRKFDNLLHNTQPITSIEISSKGCSSKNLHLCALIRLLTDKPTQDQALKAHFINIWEVDPGTSFEPLGKGTFLVEFATQQDHAKVLDRGPWLYRQDFLAMKMIANQQELSNVAVNQVQMWVQLHNIPPGALSDDGILEIASQIGTPCSQVSVAFIRSKRFYKLKVERDANLPLPATVLATLPSKETFTVYLTYEKLHRFCSFCTLLGHERDTCPDYTQLFRVSLLPNYSSRKDLQELLKSKAAPWLSSAAYIPVNPTHSDPCKQPSPHPQPSPSVNLKRAKSPPYHTPPLITDNQRTDSMELTFPSLSSPSKPPLKRTKAASGFARPLDI